MKPNQFSKTALLIARANVFLAVDPDNHNLVSKEALEWSLKFVAVATGQQNYDQKCRNGLYCWFIRCYERLICPGIIEHYLNRKQYIEQQTRRMLTEGMYQRVVNLAGGFDTLVLRLASQYPDIEFIEVDHPATQRVKQHAVGNHQRANVKFVPIDYTTHALVDVLETNNSTGTLFIAEGLLMYLSEQEVRTLFQSLKQLSPHHRSLIFTYLPDETRSETLLTRLWLALKQENLRWAPGAEELQQLTKSTFSCIDANEPVTFDSAGNFLLREMACIVST